MRSLPHIKIRDLKDGEERFFDLNCREVKEVPQSEAYNLKPEQRPMRYLCVENFHGGGLNYRPPSPHFMFDFQQVADVQATLEYTVRHAGQEYNFWSYDPTKVDVVYDEQKIVRSGQLEHLRNYYTCRGGHVGPDILVYLQNPRPDPDPDGFYIEDDGLFWADDNTEVEPLVLDTYLSAIHDQERESLNHS